MSKKKNKLTPSATKNAFTGPRGLSFFARMLRRTVLVTWRTPSRQVVIRFFVLKIWTTRSRQRRRDPYLSTPHALKFNHQVFLGNLLTRSTNVFKFHSLLCSLFSAAIFILKISQIFENPRFSSSPENSTFGLKLFINISSKNRTVSRINSKCGI